MTSSDSAPIPMVAGIYGNRGPGTAIRGRRTGTSLSACPLSQKYRTTKAHPRPPSYLRRLLSQANGCRFRQWRCLKGWYANGAPAPAKILTIGATNAESAAGLEKYETFPAFRLLTLFSPSTIWHASKVGRSRRTVRRWHGYAKTTHSGF